MTTISSRSIRSSSSISTSASAITVRRGVANSSLIAVSSCLDDRLDARARAQDVEIVGDLVGELVELGLDLVAAQSGEPLQAQIEDGLGLLGRQPRRALGAALCGADRRSARSAAPPSSPAIRAPSRLRAPRSASFAARISSITSSILATATARPTSTWARSRALPSRILGAPRHDLFAEGDEGRDHVLQRHQQRPAAVERQHVDAEGRLQRREAVELVQHHVALGVALQLDHHAMPSRSLSSRMSEMPSIRLSRTSSAMRSTMRALFT